MLSAVLPCRRVRLTENRRSLAAGLGAGQPEDLFPCHSAGEFALRFAANFAVRSHSTSYLSLSLRTVQ